MSLIPSTASGGHCWSLSTFPNTVASGCPRLLCMRTNCCRCSAFSCRNLGPCWARIIIGSGSVPCSCITSCFCWTGGFDSGSFVRTLLEWCSASLWMDPEELAGTKVASPLAESAFLANMVISSLAGWQLRMSCFRFNRGHSSHLLSQKTWALCRWIPKLFRNGACWALISLGGGRQRSAPLQISTPTIWSSGNVVWISCRKSPSVKKRLPTFGATFEADCTTLSRFCLSCNWR